MENKEYRAWFENTRKSNQETIDQTEAIFEGLILKIASGGRSHLVSLQHYLLKLNTDFYGFLISGGLLLPYVSF